MSEFLEELLNQHMSLLNSFEKTRTLHLFEMKELDIELKNRTKQKKTALKIQIHNLEVKNEGFLKELEMKNSVINEIRSTFEENLKVLLFFFVSLE